MKFKDYVDLKRGLETLPIGWYPALIQAMVDTAYKKKIFKENQASVFIHRACESVTEPDNSPDAKESCGQCGSDMEIIPKYYICRHCNPQWSKPLGDYYGQN